MGLYETRVVEGMPEKISNPRWPTKRIANAVLFFCYLTYLIYLYKVEINKYYINIAI